MKYPYNGIKLSQLILELQAMQERLGDVPVTVIAGGGGDNRYPVRQAWGPSIVPAGPNAVAYIDAY